MSDYIKREDAIEAVIAQRHKAELSEHNFALRLAEDAIRHLPSADTAEVVRCKDCKHWHIDSHCDGYRSAEDFCSWGERRKDGEA